MERFKNSFMGYNIKEVNRFVDSTLSEYASLLSKYKKCVSELETLKKRGYIDTFENLKIASEASYKIKDLAHTEAKNIIDDAKEYASHIVNDALEEANKIKKETARTKENLHNFKTQLQSAYQKQLDTIKNIDDIDVN